LLATCFTLFSYLACSLMLKLEVTCSSKFSIEFQWAAWCYVPGDRTLQSQIGLLICKLWTSNILCIQLKLV
jgi:hypothetical protein